MNLIDKIQMLKHIAIWRFTWNKRDIHFRPSDLNPEKFLSGYEAAQKFKDGQTVVSCGMAGHARCSIFYWSVRDLFEATNHPKDLTWITVGAQGSRGRVPGTIEELDLPGIITTYISGHTETEKSLLKLADKGLLELHTMAQGMQSFLLEAQGKGIYELESDVGLGTFLDPRVGNGSAVSPNAKQQFIEAKGDKLVYRLPKIDVAIFNAPYADKEGNIYFKNASSLTENYEVTEAAYANGGLVMPCVGGIIEKNDAEISIPAEKVSYIVYNPRNEQTGSIPMSRYWPMFTVGAKHDVNDAVEKLKFANNVLKITPVRGDVENAMARLAADLFLKASHKGAFVNIGVGLPEEVCRLLYENGLHEDVTFSSETGVYGGLPTMGIFFGGAINPERMEGSSWMFHQYEENLDVTSLGFLQVDSEGNVNVSKRGPRMLDYVGPGGFPNIVHGAKTILFIGSWAAHSKMAVRNGQLVIENPGTPKFVEKVDQITFSGQQALKMGKKVYYITNLGLFKLTEAGLQLVQVMPGIDIQKDILDTTKAKILLPENGEVPIVKKSVVTGEGFELKWNE